MSLLVTLFQIYVQNTSHPMMIVTGIYTLTSTLIMAFTPLGKSNLVKYVLSLYVWIHTIATVLVYKDWLPENLKGNKQVFEYQILVSYLLINSVPYHEFLFEFFTQGFVVLLGAYFQAQGEYNSELVEESLDAFVMRRLYKYILIVILITLGQYFIQFDYLSVMI